MPRWWWPTLILLFLANVAIFFAAAWIWPTGSLL